MFSCFELRPISEESDEFPRGRLCEASEAEYFRLVAITKDGEEVEVAEIDRGGVISLAPESIASTIDETWNIYQIRNPVPSRRPA